jgi:hypothetical protein
MSKKEEQQENSMRFIIWGLWICLGLFVIGTILDFINSILELMILSYS